MNHDVLHWALIFFFNGMFLSFFTCIAVLYSNMSRPAKHETIGFWAGVSIFYLVLSGILFVAAHLTWSLQWVS